MAYSESDDRKIQRLPKFFRDVEHARDAYDPKVVSFGPYHHGKPELQLCQTAKRKTLEMFLEGSGETVEFFQKKVLEIIPYARSCYIDDSTEQYINDRAFAEMMLLDATFLIFYMEIKDEQNGDLLCSITNYLGSMVYSLVCRDLFLLENQIPFRILMLLIDLRYGVDKGEEFVNQFVHETIWGSYTQQQSQQVQRPSPPLHLFEAFRTVLICDGTPNAVVRMEENTNTGKNNKTFRSAKDLKAKGICFKPSDIKSLKAIKFNSFAFSGELELPIWFVTHLSKVFFPNMIAYEVCPGNNQVDATVTSYLAFMKSLIESPADVKELREKRILITTLGSDKDVMRFFNNIYTLEEQSMFTFSEVEQRIQEHYDSTAKTWIAELNHTYLGSPRAIIAWFAGFMLLVLTMVQTYFTIYAARKTAKD